MTFTLHALSVFLILLTAPAFATVDTEVLAASDVVCDTTAIAPTLDALARMHARITTTSDISERQLLTSHFNTKTIELAYASGLSHNQVLQRVRARPTTISHVSESAPIATSIELPSASSMHRRPPISQEQFDKVIEVALRAKTENLSLSNIGIAAAESGDEATIQALLHSMTFFKFFRSYLKSHHATPLDLWNPDAFVVDGMSGLQYPTIYVAASSGKVNVVQMLLDAGVDVEATSPGLDRVIHSAANLGRLEVVKYLISRKADINSKTEWSEYTALHLASMQGHLPIVQALIDAKVDVHARSIGGFTPIHLAAKHGHPQVIEALVAAGADANLPSHQGYTPLDLALSNYEDASVAALIRSGVTIKSSQILSQALSGRLLNAFLLASPAQRAAFCSVVGGLGYLCSIGGVGP